MTTSKEALELKGCPFCGATPHRGLGKVYHDQLHGEPHQDFSIWCPKGHAEVTGVNAALAADEWNTRETASLQGEDAVERVARIKSLLASFHRNSCYPEAMTGELNDAAERILATGLVPDEAAIKQPAPWVISYTNYRGETSVRRIVPISIRFGSTEWHPEPQWLLLAWDDDKQDDREFALKDFGSPEAAIRADEREKCAKVAVGRRSPDLVR